MYEAIVLADSISPEGVRVTSFQATFPRQVQSEAKTHRSVSGNASSTRAIPLKDQLRNLLTAPFVPEEFGTNRPGMQPGAPLTGGKAEKAREGWFRGRDRVVTTSIELMLGEEIAGELLGYDPKHEFADGQIILSRLDELIKLIPVSEDGVMPDLSDSTILNVSKELANRWLETPMWITNIFTATEYEHMFNLRDHPDAQGEIQKIAKLMREARDASIPKQLDYGQWHTPFVTEAEYPDLDDRIRVSAARCAASSYNRQNAPSSYEALMKRYWSLRTGWHMSPLEHQLRPMSPEEQAVRRAAQEAARHAALLNGLDTDTLEDMVRGFEFKGNVRGWHQHRKDIKGEHLFDPRKG